MVGRKLGQGGFGVLHIARDSELDRDVAIKFLRPEHAFRPQIVQRFLQEARAAARINHPGIVTVFESGIVGGTNTRADGTVYIAMELLAGETLAERLKARGKLPVAEALGIARQLATALAAAHTASIVHRDLKPQNVFLVRDSAVVGGERVKILDFGIAKLVDDFGSNVQTHSMQMLGTPMYMSPEQCKSSAKVDARSDIYALGCMLFELVCGRTPFDGDSGELIAKHQLVAPPQPRAVDPSLPEPLERLILAMLAKSPDDRPQSMDAVIDALHALGDGGSEHTLDSAPRALAELPTVAETHPRSRRMFVIIGALAAIVFGIGVGLISVHGSGSNDQPAPAPVATPAPMPAPAPPPVVAQVVAADAAAAEPPPAPEGVVPIEFDDVSDSATPTHAKSQPHRSGSGKTAPAADCDPNTLEDQARNDEAIGQHGAALMKMEKAIACKPTERRYALAFMSACNAGIKAKAKAYYFKVPASSRGTLSQMCVRNGISVQDLENQ